jgi:hypothetical protein
MFGLDEAGLKHEFESIGHSLLATGQEVAMADTLPVNGVEIED